MTAERVCFTFELNEGAEAAYEDAHRAIPGDLADLIRAAGVSDYSIFRDGTRLIAVLKAEPSWKAAKAQMAASPVQAAWEQEMGPLIKWQLDADGNVNRIPEVFRLD